MNVGCFVGDKDSGFDGYGVGDVITISDGLSDGLFVGLSNELPIGTPVGRLVGDCEGDADGNDVGCTVGERDTNTVCGTVSHGISSI